MINVKNKIINGPIFLLALFTLVSCFNKQELQIIHISGETMGTTYNVKYVPNKSFPIEQKVLENKIDVLLKNVNQVASTYISNSEISKINKADSQSEITLSPMFIVLMNEAVEMNKLSKGLFDPSLGPLINLWGFGPEKKVKAPKISDIKKALGVSGMKNFKFHNKKLFKAQAQSQLDFSAFAKGYGVDSISQLLESIQLDDYFVEIGGEVRTRGQNKVWRVGVERPDSSVRGQISKVLELNGALATSGDYRNYYIDGGKKFAHGLNFQTGKPVNNGIASVSIFHPISTMRADSWATSLMVSSGLEESVALIKEHKLAAMIIYREGDVLKTYESPAWQSEFQ